MTNELFHLRCKNALTQTELAALIGTSQTSIGRIEAEDNRKIQHVRLDVAFGLQVVFGKRPDRLFSELLVEVEDAVMRRAALLDRALDGLTDRAAEHKRALLADMVRRAAQSPIRL